MLIQFNALHVCSYVSNQVVICGSRHRKHVSSADLTAPLGALIFSDASAWSVFFVALSFCGKDTGQPSYQCGSLSKPLAFAVFFGRHLSCFQETFKVWVVSYNDK